MRGIIRDGGVVREEHVFTDGLSGGGLYWREREGLQELLACARNARSLTISILTA